MCTTVAKSLGGLYFGRNMDIEYSFGEELIFVPRGFILDNKREKVTDHFAFMGMGTVIDGYPMLAEGVNEFGLCVAGLNFKGNAAYYGEESGKINLAPYELIPYILGKCKNLKDTVTALKRINLIALRKNKETPLPTLHFHIADKSGSLTYETTVSGSKIYKNPVGVLTNNPEFSAQLMMLSGYENLKNRTPHATFSVCAPYSLGLGAMGLPGDFSSQSRFVRAAFIKHYTEWDRSNAVYDMYRILDSVSVPRGCVLTDEGKLHYTTYQICIDADTLVYYCRRYGSCGVSSVSMDSFGWEENELYEIKFK